MQQNSFIIVMALGMLLVIVSGHIDLSVGSVAGFIGALAAHDDGALDAAFQSVTADRLPRRSAALIGAAQGYWIAYLRIPSFIVTLAGMLVFRGLARRCCGASVGPFPTTSRALPPASFRTSSPALAAQPDRRCASAPCWR